MGEGEIKNHFDEARGEQPELSEPEIREILKENYGLKFIDHSPKLLEQIPKDFDYDKFRSIGTKKEAADIHLRTAFTFLKQPIIEDEFGSDHNSRRKFKDEIKKRYGEIAYQLLDNNKLRLSRISSLSLMFNNLIDDIERSESNLLIAKTIKELNEKRKTICDWKKYNNLFPEEKKEVVKKIDEILVEFLNLFKKS